MKSQEHQGAAERSFRMARPPGRAAAGIDAAVAIVSFAFLVFGPLSDQRAFALAGVHGTSDPGSVDTRGPGLAPTRPTRSASDVSPRERIARTTLPGLTARLAFGMAMPP